MNPMNFITKIFISFAFFLPVFCLQADFSDRMKNRLTEVITAKDAGSVGEGVDGYLHLREVDNTNAKKLVESENADRKSLFQALSRKTGGSEETVARKFSQAIASKAKKGHWFKKSSGDWVRK